MSKTQRKNQKMNKTNNKYRDTVVLALGELAVALLTVCGFLVADMAFGTGFSLAVVFGALLGAAVIVVNFFALSVSVNRAVDRYLAERGNAEMSDEEAEKFTNDHSAVIQNSIKLSYIIRTVSMLAVLVVAFLMQDVFNPLAAAIPLLAFRPLIMLSEVLRRRSDAPIDESKLIKYDNEETSEEKESDE